MSKLAISLLRTDNSRTVLGVGPILPGYTPYGFFKGAHVDRKVVLGFNGEIYMHGTSSYFLGQGKRVYSSVLMRFSSPDTLSPFLSGGLNSYCYCRSDPVNFTDPDGRMPKPSIVNGRFQTHLRSAGPVAVAKRPSKIAIWEQNNRAKALQQQASDHARLSASQLTVDEQFQRMLQAGSLQGRYTEFPHIQLANLDRAKMVEAKSLVEINYGGRLTTETVHEWTSPSGNFIILDTAHFDAMIDYSRVFNQSDHRIKGLETLRKQYIMKHAHKYPKPNSVATRIDQTTVRR